MRSLLALAGVIGLSSMLAACSGSSSGSSSSLSADEAAYESFALTANGGVHAIVAHWNNPMVSGTDYMYSEDSSYEVSPLTAGAQVTALSVNNMASTLSMPKPVPTRVLSSGAIVVAATNPGYASVSYVENGIRYDFLATDQRTIVYSRLRNNITVVSLSGTISSAPAELQTWTGGFLASSLLKPGATFSAGASYLKHDATQIGDAIFVGDCNGTTYDANISPCAENTTLSRFFPRNSTTDGVTYQLSDGTISTIQGVTAWVANQPRSSTVSATTNYRVYFQLNGNIYSGVLDRDGTPILPGGGNSQYLLFNQAFLNSIQSAITF
jgi:hypothetical protein